MQLSLHVKGKISPRMLPVPQSSAMFYRKSTNTQVPAVPRCRDQMCLCVSFLF